MSPLEPSGSVQRGILFVVMMTACFACLDASAKWAGSQLPVIEIMWGRFVFNTAFVALFFGRRRPKRLLQTRRPLLQAIRAVFMIGATVTFWTALQYLPLAEATTIGFASPLLLTALSVPLLKERVGPYRWGAVVVGMIGVVIAMRPGTGAMHWAVVLPLGTALCHALYQIVTRRLAGVDPPGTTLFCTALGGLVITSALVPFVWRETSPVQWGWFAWLGLLGAVGHYWLIRAFESAPASVLAPFGYTTLVWAITLGWIFYGNLPDLWTLAGGAVIVASGLFILYRERVIARRAQG